MYDLVFSLTTVDASSGIRDKELWLQDSGVYWGRAEDETATWKPQQSERSKLPSWNLGKYFESESISRDQ